MPQGQHKERQTYTQTKYTYSLLGYTYILSVYLSLHMWLSLVGWWFLLVLPAAVNLWQVVVRSVDICWSQWKRHNWWSCAIAWSSWRSRTSAQSAWRTRGTWRFCAATAPAPSAPSRWRWVTCVESPFRAKSTSSPDRSLLKTRGSGRVGSAISLLLSALLSHRDCIQGRS